MRNFKHLNRPFGTPFSTDYLSEDAQAAEFRGEGQKIAAVLPVNQPVNQQESTRR